MREANEIRTARARRLRKNSTNAELHLWYRLKSRSLGGFKFVRQEPIGKFVVDFICRDRRLIVEVDGAQHDTNPQDVIRDQWLTEHRYRVLRFWNNDVLRNTDGVLQIILDTLHIDTPPHPTACGGRPLPASGER